MNQPATKKMLCPFCGYGCEFGLAVDDLGIRGVEYLKDTANAGRLCPRGSAAALYMDHDRRLTQPVKNGRPLTWDRLNKEVRKMVSEPDRLAVVFDRNITQEEHNAILSFCRANSIDLCASAYLESESVLAPLIGGQEPFAPGDIDQAQLVIAVGDIFNQSPMISREIIGWRLRDRKNRFVVVDAINSHTAAFATDFLKTRAGAEPLILLALARALDKNVVIEESGGVPRALIDGTSQLVKGTSRGLIVATVAPGRSYDDSLWTDSLQLLQEYSGMKVVPLFEYAARAGTSGFAGIMNAIRAKQVRNLLCLGELFPYHYPQLARELRGVNVIATTPLNARTYTAVPSALNLEKNGTITTISGPKKLSGAIPAPSGARSVQRLLEQWGASGPPAGATATGPGPAADLKKRVEQSLERGRTRKKRTLLMVGEKRAYDFMAFFGPETVKIHSADASGLRVRDGDEVYIESQHAKQCLKARVADDAEPGVITVPAETGATRGLFDYWNDDATLRFMPTEVELWRKE